MNTFGSIVCELNQWTNIMSFEASVCEVGWIVVGAEDLCISLLPRAPIPTVPSPDHREEKGRRS